MRGLRGLLGFAIAGSDSDRPDGDNAPDRRFTGMDHGHDLVLPRAGIHADPDLDRAPRAGPNECGTGETTGIYHRPVPSVICG